MKNYFSYIGNMQEFEIDGLYFIYDKNDIFKKHDFAIKLERDIKLQTPCCVLMEATVQGSCKALESKIEQLIRLLSILPTSFNLIKGYFEDNKILSKLINSKKLKFYPFIMIDGILDNQHYIFNNIERLQKRDLFQKFPFYNMTVDVSQSANRDIRKPYLQQRIDNQFMIDLVHISNPYDPEQLYLYINTINLCLNERINNVKQELKKEIKEEIGRIEKKLTIFMVIAFVCFVILVILLVINIYSS